MIFGESGGGWKVTTLMAMNSAKGLFHRAVAQSGPALDLTEAADAENSYNSTINRTGTQSR